MTASFIILSSMFATPSSTSGSASNSLFSDIAFRAFLNFVAFDNHEFRLLLRRSWSMSLGRLDLLRFLGWIASTLVKVECVGDRNLAARKALCGIPIVGDFHVVLVANGRLYQL